MVGLLWCEGVLREIGLEIWFRSRESMKKNNITSICKDMQYHLVCAWLKNSFLLSIRLWSKTFFRMFWIIILCQNFLVKISLIKKKEPNFGNYDLATLISWPFFLWINMRWIMLESSKRFYPKNKHELFQCLKNFWEGLPSTFFKNCWKKCQEFV